MLKSKVFQVNCLPRRDARPDNHRQPPPDVEVINIFSHAAQPRIMKAVLNLHRDLSLARLLNSETRGWASLCLIWLYQREIRNNCLQTNFRNPEGRKRPTRNKMGPKPTRGKLVVAVHYQCWRFWSKVLNYSYLQVTSFKKADRGSGDILIPVLHEVITTLHFTNFSSKQNSLLMSLLHPRILSQGIFVTTLTETKINSLFSFLLKHEHFHRRFQRADPSSK